MIQGGYPSLLMHIQRGALVEILPDLRPEPLTASFIVAHRRNLSPRVRAFMKWTEEVLRLILSDDAFREFNPGAELFK